MTPVETHLGGLVELYRFARHPDDRGALTAFDFSASPFRPVRAFVVEGRQGAVRGGHGHIAGRQLLVCIRGRIAVEVRNAGESVSVELNAEQNAMLISSPVWAQQTYLDDGAALLVFCDTPYNSASYVTAS